MVGIKGKSGRQPSWTSQVNKALKSLDASLPTLIEKLITRAETGDREALIYLIDRRMGKPRQEIDNRVTATVSMSADDYKIAAMKALEAQDRFLNGPVVTVEAVELDNNGSDSLGEEPVTDPLYIEESHDQPLSDIALSQLGDV